MYTLTDAAPTDQRLVDFPAPAGQVVSGAFDDALETNPVPLYMLSRELNAQRDVGPKLEWWEAQEQAKHAGVKVNVPDEGISQGALAIMIERRKDQASRDLLFARKEGFGATAGMFAAGTAGALMDPLNVTAGFIPVLSGTRYAQALSRAATAGGRAGIRLGVGAAEGAVGSAIVEAPTLSLHGELQDEYSLYDSLANMAFGTFASSGIRGVTGAMRDRWKGIQAARQEDFLRSVDPAEWKAVREAYEQQIERDMFADLEGGFSRGAGPDEGLRARWEEERDAAVKERVVQTDANAAVPGPAEVGAAISDDTHAQALKTAVAQAIEGRRIDVDPVIKQDPVFGQQRMSEGEVRQRAQSNMAPENLVSSDPEASKRADLTIETEAPSAKPGRAEPPPPRGSRGKVEGAEATDLPKLAEQAANDMGDAKVRFGADEMTAKEFLAGARETAARAKQDSELFLKFAKCMREAA